MIPKKQPRNTPFLFSDYETLLNHKNPLFILANKINWQIFEDAFLPLYSKDTGRPGKPIRMMVGLLILKQYNGQRNYLISSTHKVGGRGAAN